ncbi:MAG: methylenetetrahydrofolate--tRNA-(uracil(54)-C(5))-methyltransferase (FADH(2)-oxidizing) TrmFO [Synergistaceae bacterium]|nr:methylenetetrahydrofolate--tRNA-(uracil(54)-C(5))-methyltransferase (FADH(2)-oxidizing) TrmFO [Synergistaceae bacterium]
MTDKIVSVVGGGLAGSEAAWQLAERGIPVTLFEMRPLNTTPAHSTDRLAEIVCSNSFGADSQSSPAGILKRELRRMGSLILRCADESSLPAGKALAVDRDIFSRLVTERLKSHPLVTIRREECTVLPSGPVIIATGPLTSPSLAEKLADVAGEGYLSFFDAVAPVVTLESIDKRKAFRSGRWGQEADYYNCPFTREEYEAFWHALTTAERAVPHDFEDSPSWFEGCLPVEVMASRGIDTLRFGPMRPVGLPLPETGKDAWAVVQLRQDNREGTLYNLVGFQTSLRWGEQERVFRMIPGLEEAEFARFGVMHRNIYVNAPAVLDPHLRFRSGREDLFLAGQITGVEGYMESTAMGLAAALNMAALLEGTSFPEWPRLTAMGSLLHYLSDAHEKGFHPMNVNLGIFPPLEQKVRKKALRCEMVSERARKAMEEFLAPQNLPAEG